MFIADFHIHSKYSRATSKDCVPEMLDLWARCKGLHLIGTGDFTHPVWRGELREKLAPAEDGLYTLKSAYRAESDAAGPGLQPRFIVSGEISSIYKKNGRVRKVHNLILLPSLEAAEMLSRRLEAIGNLHSDGRPILGLDSHDLLEITLETAPDAIFIPAHIWTPHFSLFGAYSGFDDIHECFEDLTGHIHALETGLSSDPSMNWRLSSLDKFTLVSNSDAHSPGNLAREANLFDTALSYPHIARALEKRDSGFYGTLEFFPEEGKYHFDGHRNCKVCLKPSETIAASGICPACGGRITVGVLHRVEALADRAEGFIPPDAQHFERLIPLHEVVASSLGVTTASKKAGELYGTLLRSLGPELFILREAPLEDIAHYAGTLVAEGIRRLRGGKVEIEPGYDGEYGKIRIFDKSEIQALSGQLDFLDTPGWASVKRDRKRGANDSAPKPASSGDMETGKIAEVSNDTGIPYGLNKEQWEAVSASDAAVAVIAGPGTGKTKTLVSRIACLIGRGVNPAHITAVTFTNKAAKEMQGRLEKQIGRKGVKGITIGTFHSICLRFLSTQNGEHPVTVIDEPGVLSIVSGIINRLGIRQPAREVLKAISLIKNGAAGQSADVPPDVYEEYCAALREYGAVDFDDILLNALALFESAQPEEAAPFRHLLVDEFQDINPVQYRLIKAWSKTAESVFVIGDPDQSIYGFRGSDPRCFHSFMADFSPVRQVRLAHNYRSTPEILHCAQAAFPRNAADFHERPLEATKPCGRKVRVLEAEDAFSEALFVAKEINRMVGGIDMLDAHRAPDAKAAKWGFGDIAVLYRTNRQALTLEQCLQKESIPYVVAGREDFLSDPQVRRAVAFFRFLLNPEDVVSLKVLMETWAYPASAAQKLLQDYISSAKTVSSLSVILDKTDFSPAFGQLPALLQKYAPIVRMEAPWKLIEDWARDLSLTGLQNIEMLINTSVMHGDMSAFLQNLALGQESDVVRSGKRSYASDAVTLMTLHGAKGLEFPVVFLCGVSDGLIPFRNHTGQCNLDEERRLFYVGMTRAKDELILLTSSPRSPFLDALPQEHLLAGSALPPRPKSEAKQLSLL